ncbi:Uncharacterised protein [Yersinia rohdei]|nr:Uncharacterised protein [Yersinia rohdei]
MDSTVALLLAVGAMLIMRGLLAERGIIWKDEDNDNE